MRRTTDRGRRRWLAPEVVQTSAMDCGPAALKCLLEGFGIPISYARLQEACQTDVDGTSVNTIEQLAKTLGLVAEQIMLPVDHVMLGSAKALPALVVVRRDGMNHFLVAWHRHGPLVQLMDPARGRRWLREDAFRSELYVHNQRVAAAAWRQWAGSTENGDALRERLRRCGVTPDESLALIHAAATDPSWRGFAILDASIRIVAELVASGGVAKGRDAARLIEVFTTRCASAADPRTIVPPPYWSVLPDAGSPGDDTVILRGAVLLRVRERASSAADGERPQVSTASIPDGLKRALTERRQSPFAYVLRTLRPDGLLPPALLLTALGLLAFGTLAEVFLLRAFLDMHSVLALREHRLAATGLLLAVLAALFVLELVLSAGALRMGRRLEARLRMAVMAKLPALDDRYFSSRLVADMAHRAHSLDVLRSLPEVAASLTRSSLQLVFTAIALTWLDPATAWLALLAAVLALTVPLVTEPALAERELRQRNHAGALARCYLDGLLGLVAARTHAAERALRRQHERLLVEWGRSSIHLLRGSIVIDGVQALLGSLLAVWLVLDFVSRGARPGGTLLLVYWAVNLPVLGRELAGVVRQVPALRNVIARLLEPLSAPEDVPDARAADEQEDEEAVGIELEGVDVHVAARPVLRDVTLTIRPGEHVAIVGRSGAGKSSLVGLLLGWRSLSAGTMRVDGHALDRAGLARLRRATAWVDPSVHLWNRSLFDNVRYGSDTPLVPDLGSIFETAELTTVLERLPQGLQSPLGEGGRLASGGEGQRVRFARALTKQSVRLAVLDEPFRGLDRRQRQQMLADARRRWRDATLICVTHDIEETLGFERVVVLDAGRIVEDGDPAALAQVEGSVYATLFSAERAVREDMWSATRWRRWRVEDGVIVEDAAPQEGQTWTRQHASSGR
jgi:ABC-type bacteriocin/lantibiotic exporter with double-glycine peptidase domain